MRSRNAAVLGEGEQPLQTVLLARGEQALQRRQLQNVFGAFEAENAGEGAVGEDRYAVALDDDAEHRTLDQAAEALFALADLAFDALTFGDVDGNGDDLLEAAAKAAERRLGRQQDPLAAVTVADRLLDPEHLFAGFDDTTVQLAMPATVIGVHGHLSSRRQPLAHFEEALVRGVVENDPAADVGDA